MTALVLAMGIRWGMGKPRRAPLSLGLFCVRCERSKCERSNLVAALVNLVAALVAVLAECVSRILRFGTQLPVTS